MFHRRGNPLNLRSGQKPRQEWNPLLPEFEPKRQKYDDGDIEMREGDCQLTIAFQEDEIRTLLSEHASYIVQNSFASRSKSEQGSQPMKELLDVYVSTFWYSDTSFSKQTKKHCGPLPDII